MKLAAMFEKPSSEMVSSARAENPESDVQPPFSVTDATLQMATEPEKKSSFGLIRRVASKLSGPSWVLGRLSS